MNCASSEGTHMLQLHAQNIQITVNNNRNSSAARKALGAQSLLDARPKHAQTTENRTLGQSASSFKLANAYAVFFNRFDHAKNSDIEKLQ